MNLDGALDIIHSTRDFRSRYHGAHIAINDGVGNFRSLPNSTLPNRPLFFSGNNDTLFKGVPIDADKLGCLDLICNDREAVLEGARHRDCVISDDEVSLGGLRVYLRD